MLLHSENILYIDSVPGIAAIRLIFIFCVLNVGQVPGAKESQDVKGSKSDRNKTKKTPDVHKKYFTEPRQKTATAIGVSSVPCQNPITNSADQPSTEKDKTGECTDQPGLTVTGLGATAKQPSKNTLTTTSNCNGGNQPTNQLSQAQGGNGTSQIAESAPGTQTDLNQPEPVTCIPLSYWLLQYFEKFGWHKVDDICLKSKVKHTFDGKRLLLNGNKTSVASVKKEVDGVLESLEILQEQTYCGKPFLPEGMKQKWIQTEKDKKMSNNYRK